MKHAHADARDCALAYMPAHAHAYAVAHAYAPSLFLLETE